MVDPTVAAKDWVKVQAAAKLTGLTLVSPAVSTTGLDDDGVSPWLDQFFGNCTESITPGCDTSTIAYMAFHDYNGTADSTLILFIVLLRAFWMGDFFCACACGKLKLLMTCFVCRAPHPYVHSRLCTLRYTTTIVVC